MIPLPKISIVIPTLNAQKTLPACLKSIKKQHYPSSKIEIIIADGGSFDNTLTIAKEYKVSIINNPLKTAESGKAVGLKQAQNKYTAFIDSDNILPTPQFLLQMIRPLENDPTLIGSEPLRFTYRPQAGFIERYASLLGANDPYAFFCRIYDRYSYLTQQWTGLSLTQKIYPNYIKVSLEPNIILPTIGANGTFFKTAFLKSYFINSPYLFDIDIIYKVINTTQKSLYFAKTKNSIIHTFCENSVTKFIRKQQRRIRDYLFYKNIRHHNWTNINHNYMIYFALYSLTVIFPLIDAFRGYFKKPDKAWFFHPIACYITLLIYLSVIIKNTLGFNIQSRRENWHQ